jgi:hypothetical protein
MLLLIVVEVKLGFAPLINICKNVQLNPSPLSPFLYIFSIRSSSLLL